MNFTLLNYVIVIFYASVAGYGIYTLLSLRKKHKEVSKIGEYYDKIYEKQMRTLENEIQKYVKKGKLKVGTKVEFNSGNYEGLTGVISLLNWNSSDTRAIFGFLHVVELSNGKIGYIEKSDHFTIVK